MKKTIHSTHSKIIKTREKYFNKTLQIILLILLTVFVVMELVALFGNRVGVITNAHAQATTDREEVQVAKQDSPMPALSIEDKIRAKFGKDGDIAVAVAKAESGLNPNANGDKHLTYWKNGKMYGDSIGIFQIRTFENRPDREALKDIDTNIEFAYKLYQAQGFYPWTVFQTKQYLSNL